MYISCLLGSQGSVGHVDSFVFDIDEITMGQKYPMRELVIHELHSRKLSLYSTCSGRTNPQDLWHYTHFAAWYIVGGGEAPMNCAKHIALQV